MKHHLQAGLAPGQNDRWMSVGGQKKSLPKKRINTGTEWWWENLRRNNHARGQWTKSRGEKTKYAPKNPMSEREEDHSLTHTLSLHSLHSLPLFHRGNAETTFNILLLVCVFDDGTGTYLMVILNQCSIVAANYFWNLVLIKPSRNRCLYVGGGSGGMTLAPIKMKPW